MDVICLVPSGAASPAMTGVWPLYVQVFGLGLLWTTLHCSGMCGPLIAGLGFGQRRDRRTAVWAAVDLGLYQSGRAVMYAAFGASAGVLGSLITVPLQQMAPWVTLILAGVFIALALRDWWPRRHVPSQRAPTPSRLAAFAGRSSRVLAQHPRRRAVILGMILAFLPCMLAFWVLSLAAASGSALHGALLMVSLVVMTIPVLLAAAWAPLAIGRLRRASAPWAARVPLALSAAWMTCIGLAGLGVVPHLHLRLGDYVVMVW